MEIYKTICTSFSSFHSAIYAYLASAVSRDLVTHPGHVRARTRTGHVPIELKCDVPSVGNPPPPFPIRPPKRVQHHPIWRVLKHQPSTCPSPALHPPDPQSTRLTAKLWCVGGKFDNLNTPDDMCAIINASVSLTHTFSYSIVRLRAYPPQFVGWAGESRAGRVEGGWRAGGG